MISLCYVEGINEVDTPWFHTQAEQEKFFDKSVVWSDDDSYYPPYFMNTIRLSSEDIPFADSSKHVNYCILDYDGKRYYYFIDSIDYVTDDLVKITIEMDTIQTYMFDVAVSKPTISRKAIMRWGDDGKVINRDYIRENLSQGNMVKKSKKALSSKGLQWIVVRTSDRIEYGSFYYDPNSANDDVKKYLESTNTGMVRYQTKSEDRSSSYSVNGGYYYLIPYGDWVGKSDSIFVKFGSTYRMLTQIDSKISRMSSDSRVLSMSLIPFNPFPDIALLSEKHTEGHITGSVIEVQSKSVTIHAYDSTTDKFTDISMPWYYFGTGTNVQDDNGDNQGYFLSVLFPKDKSTESSYFKDIPFLSIKPNEAIVSFDTYVKSSKVTSAKSKWDSHNVPAMLDEDYLQLHIGDNGGTTIAPLFYAVMPAIRCSEWATMDGGMAYAFTFQNSIGNDYGGVINDMNNTSLLNSNSVGFDLYTDPWKNYEVTHKGSLITDAISTASNGVAKVAGVMGLAGAMGKAGTAMQRSQEGSGYAGTDVAFSNGYVTGFSKYRIRYRGIPLRDHDTGRFVDALAYTYGGN